MGLSWNTWYNPLDNVAAVAKTLNPVRSVSGFAKGGQQAAKQTGEIGDFYRSTDIGSNNPLTNTTTQQPQNTGVLGENTEPNLFNGGDNGSGGSRTTSSFDPNSIYESEDIIRQANDILGRLGGQRETGLANIGSIYGNYRTNLQTQFGRNQADYNQNRTSTIRDNEIAKNNIDRKVASRANSLSRYLGSRGAGDSQAASVLAPYAAAKTGTQLRAGVNRQFGANLSNLDQSFGRYKTDYDNSILSLGDQETKARNDLEADILRQEYSARDNLSRGNTALDFARRGNSAGARAIRNEALPGLYAILQQIDALGKQRVTPTIQDATYDAPDIEQYTTEGVQDVAGVDPVVADSISPLYQYLLKRQEEDDRFFNY
jgi:hypothetical protein